MKFIKGHSPFGEYDTCQNKGRHENFCVYNVSSFQESFPTTENKYRTHSTNCKNERWGFTADFLNKTHI